ncbi:MAG: YeeE/YedE family protein, partial [Gemmatimonadota bacterium]|nr:YeeE/YedE family protein [Gemmatimonadota bacterium]
MLELIGRPWPWYVAGPLLGLLVPALLLLGGKTFGISANFRHLCAAVLPETRLKPAFLCYDWRRTGGWNLMLALGIVAGGFLATRVFGVPDVGQQIAEATRQDLQALGLTSFSGFAPAQVFSWSGLLTLKGFVAVAVGGFLVGFGARWAGGCTSGHAVSGLADMQIPSLVAVVGFFAGGLLVSWFVLPH